MHTHLRSRSRPWTAAVLAGAAMFGYSEVSHAHSSDAFVIVILTPVGHAMLLPAYVSTIYYGAAPEKKMPLGWAIPNLVAATGTGALGVFSFAALENGD